MTYSSDPYNDFWFIGPHYCLPSKREAPNKDNQRADEAMRLLWNTWFRFYDQHFRGPGIAISMADQQAFYEIAQPIMRNLVNGGQSPRE